MGLPVMNIIFTAAARDSVRRSERNTVGMVVKDSTPPAQNPIVVYREGDIPDTLSADNQEQIKLARKGYVNSPGKVVVYVLAKEAENYDEALEYFESKKVTWMCFPTIIGDGQTEAVVAWIKGQREERNKVKAVLPGTEADCEGIVNLGTENIPVGDGSYTAEKYCSRIAGLLAGTPSQMGATYAVLEEASAFKTDRRKLDQDIETGKFMLFYDGEKVKVARAVNSLQTIKRGKSEAWKKIKVVETMDMIHDDLVLLVEDNYIGKYTNTYDNKCLLLSAVRAYLKEIARNGLIEDYEVNLDADAIRDYIVNNKGVPRDEAEAMKDAEVRKQYTDEKVFLKASITVADVMEDISLNITV